MHPETLRLLLESTLGSPSPAAARDARLLRARAYADAHFEEPVDLDRLARVACYAPHHFHRLFRATFGDTPHQHLTRRRVERARELLEHTDLDVTTICMAVGFQSLGSFSALFRRHTGHPPSRYRRRFIALQYTAPESCIPWCFLSWFSGAPKNRKIREAPVRPITHPHGASTDGAILTTPDTRRTPCSNASLTP